MDAEAPASHSIDLRERAKSVVHYIADRFVIDSMLVDTEVIAKDIVVAGELNDNHPINIPSILSMRKFKIGLSLDLRCPGCQRVLVAVRAALAKYRSHGIDVRSIGDLDDVLENDSVKDAMLRLDDRIVRPVKHCTWCGRNGHTRDGYWNYEEGCWSLSDT